MEDGFPHHRIACLDGLRAMAATMVMIFHFIGRHGESPGIIQAAAVGQTGVDLFFVLSGFLITRQLLLARESPRFFKAFYARRVLRIFPLYHGFLLVFYFVLPLLGAERSTFGQQWWTWFFLSNVPATFPALPSYGPNQFWSLAVEEHFYLVWPLAVRGFSEGSFRRLILATLLAPLMLRVWFLHLGIETAYFTLTRLDSIGYGALLAVLLPGKRAAAGWLVGVFRGLLIVLPVLLLPLFWVPADLQPDWAQAMKFSLVPAFYFALIGFCIVDPAAWWFRAFLSRRWLRWLGAVSFGLYVFHPTCFALVDTFVGPAGFLRDTTLCFGLTYLAAFLSFLLLERPILRFKRLFPY